MCVNEIRRENKRQRERRERERERREALGIGLLDARKQLTTA